MFTFFSNFFGTMADCYGKCRAALRRCYVRIVSFFHQIDRAVEPLPVSESPKGIAKVASEFRIKPCLRDSGCRCEFEVSEMVTDKAILSFESRASQLGRQTEMVRELFQLQGVKQIWLTPYQVTVNWSEVFTSQEMVPRIKSIITKHLSV